MTDSHSLCVRAVAVLLHACKHAVMEASPSKTAMRVAIGRGLHRLWDAPPWVLDDPFALILVGPEWQDLAGSPSNPVLRQAIAELVVRSRYAEDRLTLGNFSQCVILVTCQLEALMLSVTAEQ